MRRRWILALVVLLTSVSVRLQAATITATGCEQGPVATAIGQAADGDTVVIPPGSCQWTGTISLGKMIMIQGAGIDVTTITSTQAGNPALFNWTMHASGGPAGFLDITLWTGNVDQVGGKPMISVNGNTAATCTAPTSSCFLMRRVRIAVDRGQGLVVDGNIRGVVSDTRCTIVTSDVCYMVKHPYWGGGNDFGYGDYSWAADHTMGTTETMAFEDSVFECIHPPPYDGYCPGMNLYAGGRRLFRFNRVIAEQIYQHGLDTPGRWRGARQDELYRNVGTYPPAWNSAMFGPRSGTLRVFDNEYIGVNGYVIDGQVQRAADVPAIIPVYPWGDCRIKPLTSISCSGGVATATASAGANPHGLAANWMTQISGSSVGAYNGVKIVTGKSGDQNDRTSTTFTFAATCGGTANNVGITIRAPWDGNTDATGYACTDGLGAGKGALILGDNFGAGAMSTVASAQQREPFYEWGNEKNGVASLYFNRTDVFDGSVVQANREYFTAGKGPRSSRPACSIEGQGWGATDSAVNWNTESAQQHANHDPGNLTHTVGEDGALDRCNGSLVWVNDWYVPLVYPHPMISGVAGNSPPNLSISSHSGDVNTTAATAALTGGCTDDVGCPSVTYACTPSCGTGTASGVNPWTQTASLPAGVSTWTVSTTDAGGLTSTASVRFYRVAAAAALPFTETFSAGTGVTWTNGYGANWTRVGAPQFGISTQQGTATVFGFNAMLFTGVPLNGDQYIEVTAVDVAPLSKQIRLCLNATGTTGQTGNFDAYFVQFDGTNSATNLIGRYDDGAFTTNYTPSGLGLLEIENGVTRVGVVKSGTTIRAIVDGFPVGPIVTTAGEYTAGTVGDCSVGVGVRLDDATVGNSTPVPPDLVAPVVAVDMPTTEGGHFTEAASVTVEAAVSDDTAVTSCSLTNSQAGVTPLTVTAGRVSTTVTLVQGQGTIYALTITCLDAANNNGSDVLTVSTQTAPPPVWAAGQPSRDLPMMRTALALALLLPALAAAQTPTVGNPVAVEFEFLDWAQATGYEVDIVNQATKVVQNTLQYGPTKPTTGTITIRLDINVQPVAHGVYVFVARGKTATGLTPSSLPSDPWERAPGPPGKPVAIGKPIGR